MKEKCRCADVCFEQVIEQHGQGKNKKLTDCVGQPIKLGSSNVLFPCKTGFTTHFQIIQISHDWHIPYLTKL